jgi:hypothetical protein
LFEKVASPSLVRKVYCFSMVKLKLRDATACGITAFFQVYRPKKSRKRPQNAVEPPNSVGVEQCFSATLCFLNVRMYAACCSAWLKIGSLVPMC